MEKCRAENCKKFPEYFCMCPDLKVTAGNIYRFISMLTPSIRLNIILLKLLELAKTYKLENELKRIRDKNNKIYEEQIAVPNNKLSDFE